METIKLLQSQIKGRPFGLEILDLIFSFFFSFPGFIKSFLNQLVDVDFFVLTIETNPVSLLLHDVGCSMQEDFLIFILTKLLVLIYLATLLND